MFYSIVIQNDFSATTTKIFEENVFEARNYSFCFLFFAFRIFRSVSIFARKIFSQQ